MPMFILINHLLFSKPDMPIDFNHREKERTASKARWWDELTLPEERSAHGMGEAKSGAFLFSFLGAMYYYHTALFPGGSIIGFCQVRSPSVRKSPFLRRDIQVFKTGERQLFWLLYSTPYLGIGKCPSSHYALTKAVGASPACFMAGLLK